MIETTGNIILDIKYIFLSFAQSFFATIPTYAWDADFRQTKIIIADKNSVDQGIVVQRPSIILSRGGYNFMKIGLDQRVQGQPVASNGIETLTGPQGTVARNKNATYTDLISASVRFMVLAKQGVEAESIASLLNNAIIGYQWQMRSHGIQKFTAIRVGEEGTLKVNADIEVAAVPIDISFTKNVTIALGQTQNNCAAYVDDVEHHEGITFRVDTAGTQIIFATPPDIDTIPTLTYVDAITLEQVTGVTLVGDVDGINKTFTVPDSGTIYGYYTLLASTDLTVTEDES